MPCWIALHASISTTESATSPVLDEASVQRMVASLALGFTPRVAMLDEAVLMDVTGSLRLFGGLSRLMQLLQQQASQFFATHQVVAEIRRAQGATSLIALGRLRMQRESAESAGDRTATRVADLPMHTLSAARPRFGVLERIGCRTWADLLRLPRDGVARRFGAELLEALDRARGSVPDNYQWLVLPEKFDEKIELNALVTHAPLLMAGVDRLLAHLQAWLLGRQSGLSALKIIWHLDKRRDVPPTGELEIRTAQPAQDLRHVARLIAEHLAQQKLPAPVHSLTLQSLATEFLADAAAATGSLLMEARKQGDSAIELIERLSARLGDENVQAWQAQADHRPEQMQRWVNARSAIKSIRSIKSVGSIKPGNSNASNPDGARSGKLKPKGNKKPSPNTDVARAEALYPSWLLPEPLRLATLGNSPVWQGKLTRLAGPQRLEVAGWLPAGADKDAVCEKHPALQDAFHGACQNAFRDYFIYRSAQGSLLWIYSERLVPTPEAVQQRAWYLHGFFA